MAERATVPHPSGEPAYEREDVGVRGVLMVAAGSLILLALIFLALAGLLRLFAERYPRPLPTELERAQIEPPPPRLQSAPKDDLSAFRAHEEAILNRWAWVDRAAGIAQIPIEQAMALLAERGWPQPDRPADAVPPRAKGDERAPSTEKSSSPAAEPSSGPHISSQEVGPAQAEPQGGPR